MRARLQPRRLPKVPRISTSVLFSDTHLRASTESRASRRRAIVHCARSDRRFVGGMSANLLGGCLCGGTRYVLDAAPSGVGDCHCIDCRRGSGAPYVTWGTVPRAHVRLTAGEVRKISHAGRVRGFAACCGTPLFFEDAPDAPSLDVTIASLDDPTPFPPRKAIWTEDRLPWVPLDPSRPHFKQSSANM